MEITIEEVIALIEECHVLELPNTLSEAIWKEDIISKLQNLK